MRRSSGRARRLTDERSATSPVALHVTTIRVEEWKVRRVEAAIRARRRRPTAGLQRPCEAQLQTAHARVLLVVALHAVADARSAWRRMPPPVSPPLAHWRRRASWSALDSSILRFFAVYRRYVSVTPSIQVSVTGKIADTCTTVYVHLHPHH